MFSFLIYLIKCEPKMVLDVLYINPGRNPFELYPACDMPLCFTQNAIPHKSKDQVFKCSSYLLTVHPSLLNNAPNLLCKTKLSEQNKTVISRMIMNDFQISFNINGSRATVPISTDGKKLNTHFSFKIFANSNGNLKISSITSSKPVNVSGNEPFDITYSFERVHSIKYYTLPDSLKKLYFFIALFLGIYFILIVKPEFTTRPISAVVSAIPQNNYILAVFCGAGCGFIAFFVALSIVFSIKPTSYKSWWLSFAIPAAASSFVNSIVTSFLCVTWKLKDVASAHYFSPLLIPAMFLTIVFSVLWIPICVGSCIIIPLKLVFSFIISVIFIKLPVNLATSIIFSMIFSINNFHHLINIPVRRFITSRRTFLVFANCLLFFILFPISKSVDSAFKYQTNNVNWFSAIYVIPIWLFSCICIGISSLALGDAEDWAMFSFISTGGAGLVFWIVKMIIYTFVDHMNGTLQVSFQAGIIGFISLFISLAGGSVSILSALIWILLTGSSAKSA